MTFGNFNHLFAFFVKGKLTLSVGDPTDDSGVRLERMLYEDDLAFTRSANDSGSKKID